MLHNDAAASHLNAAILDELYPYSFLPGSESLHRLEETLCKLTDGNICRLSLALIIGSTEVWPQPAPAWFAPFSDLIESSSQLDDVEAIRRLEAHFPAGTSVKDMEHFAQFIRHSPAFFGKFNYGKERSVGLAVGDDMVDARSNAILRSVLESFNAGAEQNGIPYGFTSLVQSL